MMSYSDEKFRQEFQPLHVPSNFNPADSSQDQVVFALAQVGAGSAEDIIRELTKYHSPVDPVPYLKVLFDKGLIGGEEVNGTMRYDLRKITRSNEGRV